MLSEWISTVTKLHSPLGYRGDVVDKAAAPSDKLSVNNEPIADRSAGSALQQPPGFWYGSLDTSARIDSRLPNPGADEDSWVCGSCARSDISESVGHRRTHQRRITQG